MLFMWTNEFVFSVNAHHGFFLPVTQKEEFTTTCNKGPTGTSCWSGGCNVERQKCADGSSGGGRVEEIEKDSALSSLTQATFFCQPVKLPISAKHKIWGYIHLFLIFWCFWSPLRLLSCAHRIVCVCVCVEWVFSHSGTFPAPLAIPAAGRQRLPTHQATLSPGPQSSRGPWKPKLRSPLTLTPAHSYSTGVEWSNLAGEPLKRVVVWVKWHRQLTVWQRLK